MIFFINMSINEVFRLCQFLLECTVEIGVRLEAESSISDAINFYVAALR